MLADDLKRAKAVMLERGWYRGAYENTETGEVCFEGALRVAICGSASIMGILTEEHRRDMLAALHFCQEHVPMHHIPRWNDDYVKSPEEILAKFDECIAKAEAATEEDLRRVYKPNAIYEQQAHTV